MPEFVQYEYQYIYEYNDDGSLKQTALYSTSNADSDTFGPQVYVVQYFYDDAGRLIRKRVVDNTTQENISTRYETEYEYDGMGRTTRERTLQYQAGAVDMEVVRLRVHVSTLSPCPFIAHRTLFSFQAIIARGFIAFCNGLYLY